MSKWFLLLGIVCGIVAAVMVNMKLSSGGKVLAFVRLADDRGIDAGAEVPDPKYLKKELLPEKFKGLTRVAIPYTKDALTWLEHRKVARPVGKGEFLLYSHFDPVSSKPFDVEPGLRAVSLPVDRVTAVSFFVKPGSRVDILATAEMDAPPEAGATAGDTGNGLQGPFRARDKRIVTWTVLQNVGVLAVGDAFTESDYLSAREEGGYTTATVQLSPADAEKLVAVLQQTRSALTLVLRNPEDQGRIDTPPVELTSLQP